MIEVRGIKVQHPGNVLALDGIDVDLHEGQHVALMGANGSGKTTLIRCLNGLLVPTAGSVRIDGMSTTEPDDLVQIRRRVGMVFQNPDDQLVATSVETEIAFGLENNGIPSEEMSQRIDLMLDTFSLTRYRDTAPHLLSGGERQRVAIAAAIALRPTYLLLDEPTALLDPAAREDFMALVDRLVDEYGISILHVTQNAEEAVRAHRLLILRAGRLVCDDGPQVVFSSGATLEQELGIPLPFSVRCCLSIPALTPPLPLTIEDLDLRLADWYAPEISEPDIASSEKSLDEMGLPGTSPSADARIRMTIRDLSHIYSEGLPTPVTALTHVNMDITDNQILAIAGASGSGKTTLVQHLNGLLRPTSGHLALDGIDLWTNDLSLQQLRQQVGLVFQFPESQLFAETVAQDVAFGPTNVGLDPESVESRVAGALAAVHLPVEEYGRRSPFHLSGGERRRVAIAGVLAMDPQILVLDEPTAGLDASSTQLLTDIVRNLSQKGRSIVLVTHDMDLIARVAPRLVILADGMVAFDGPTCEAFETELFDESSALKLPAAFRFRQLRRRRDHRTPSLLTCSDVTTYARTLKPPQ